MQFVDVVPALRSIPGKDIFTYAVPEQFGRLTPGQLVDIPWRSGRTFGYVLANRRSTTIKTRPITKLYDVVLPPAYQAWLRWLADYYHIAYSHAFKLAVPRPLRRNTTTNAIAPRPSRKPKTEAITILYDTQACLEQAVRDGIKKYWPGKIAVLVPEESYLAPWSNRLADYQPKLISSRQAAGQLWRQFRNLLDQPTGCYLGTRRLSLYPLTEIDLIIIIDPEHPAHSQWAMKPPYHVWTVAQAQASHGGVALLAYSQAPLLEQVRHSRLSNHYVAQRSPHPVSIIDVSAAPGQQAIVSDIIVERCRAHQTVFLWLNKKGHGSLLGCSNCHHLSTETTARVCPHCGNASLRLIGDGTGSVQQTLRQLLPERSIIELTKDTPNTTIPYQRHPIIVGTDFAVEHIDWSRVQWSAVLAVDWLLAQPDFRATETVWRKLVLLRNASPELYIQTRVPGHPVFGALRSFTPTNWWQTELAQRRRYQFIDRPL